MLISCAVLFVIICLSGCLCKDQSYVETAPLLTLLPSHSWYLMGESVTINCSVPNKSKKQCFKFYKDYISISTQNSSTFDIQSLENSDGGLYSCETLQNNSSSTRSNKRQIHVYALPPPSIVSLEPSQDMYMAGQPVGMTCSTFRGREQKILRFYKNGHKIFSLESCTGNATLHIDTSLPESGGNYSCDYQTKRLGTWISSIPRTVFVNISDQTTAGTTISTSVLTMEFPRNGITTSEAQETHISTGTATNAVSMASVSSTPNQDENAVAKTSPAIHISTGTSINSVSIASVSSPSKQHENTDAQTISPETHSSTASALLTSQNSMVSQWTNHTNLTTTSDHSATWMFYVIGGCVLFILLCALLVVLLLRGNFSRKGNKAKPVKAPLWANNDISDTKKSKRTYKETEIDMTAHIYSELDQSPPLRKLSSAPRPSASLGSLAHFKPSAVPVYSTVQAVSPLPCVYSTLLSQKPLQTSCPTLLQPENSSSSVY